MSMRFALFVRVASALLASQQTLKSHASSDTSLDHFIYEQSQRSIRGIVDNIGNEGEKAPGAAAGVVVASPSTANPDYYYTWTRDAALTVISLVNLRYGQADECRLEDHIQDYVSAQAVLQNVSNPSGSLQDGRGLGEPKFETDLNPFTQPWGRPQRDGPALRSMAMMTYADQLIYRGQFSTVETILWPIIANDLAYVGQYWNETGFDLWEEILGSSFFTVATQHRALVQGANLARKLGKSCPFCESQAPQILCFLQSFWNGRYIVANINVDSSRSGIDANSLLGMIHTFDPEGLCDDSTFQPCSARALANHKVFIDSFRSIYKINGDIPKGFAANVGRYPEDVYQGGNPWYLSELAAAELLYDALYQWRKIGVLDIADTSLAFFRDFDPSVATGSYSAYNRTFWELTSAIQTYADGFLRLVRQYTPSDGSLAEQYSRDTGVPLSANDLSWSFASFLTASQRRAAIMPPSWGQKHANAVPTACSAAPVTGTYQFPTATFPTCTALCIPATSSVPITFYVIEGTVWGESIFIAGNISALGNWGTNNGFPLSASLYTEKNNLWFGSVGLIPPDTPFEYKYYKHKPDGLVVYESGANRVFTAPAGCPVQPNIHDVWRS